MKPRPPSVVYARAVVSDYMLHHLGISGKDAERIMDGAPCMVHAPGWRRSFAVNEFARRIADCFPHLEPWQAEGAARFLMTYDPETMGVPMLFTRPV